jgi:hypothetical protein
VAARRQSGARNNLLDSFLHDWWFFPEVPGARLLGAGPLFDFFWFVFGLRSWGRYFAG